MTITYLKRATKTPQTDSDDVSKRVQQLLLDLKSGGEATASQLAEELDGWVDPIVLSDETRKSAIEATPDQLKKDIAYAHTHVRRFAEKQREALIDFEVELSPGVFTGQRQIPISTAGCYVPGGRYAHIASAIMSVTTAKAAGVKTIIVASPATNGRGVHPAIIYACDLCGADTILQIGGVQAIASLAHGYFTGQPADIIVGPGNRFVAQAKLTLFGEVGIDLLAGPSEIAIIADETADPHLVAIDLVGQAEHGVDSPVWLVTSHRPLAETVLETVPKLIEDLPQTQRDAATLAWRDYAEVVLCDTREEIVTVSDKWAPEHLEVHTKDTDWWLESLSNYGSLFLGEETTVAFGDKCSGTNHILPTKGAARYTGGLSVGKFIKTVTYQRLKHEAVHEMASVTGRISRHEGMEAHARTADARIRKFSDAQS